MNIIETKQVRESLRMAMAVADANETGPIGQIIGQPGTGKTFISHYLVEKAGAFRVCCHQGINNKLLVSRIYEGLGMAALTGSAATLLSRVEHLVQGRLMAVDEANHLTWRQLELLRYLADEKGMSLVLLGTDLLDRPFRDGRTSILLAQLSSRIGAKRVRLEPFTSLEDVSAYQLIPEFGKVNKTTAKQFYKASSGYWRDARELVSACRRVMKTQNIETLTVDVIQAASSSMKPRGK